MSVICYRVIMTADYCVSNSGVNCLLVTTVVSSVLNAVSILILGKIYDKLAVLLTNWGECSPLKVNLKLETLKQRKSIRIVNNLNYIRYHVFLCRKSQDPDAIRRFADSEAVRFPVR